jgi:protein tyrosine/serine phosphatase
MKTENNLPNFYKVSEDLYRGAQPTRGGFAVLKRMGIKTIINLRWLHSDGNLIQDLGFAYYPIYCKAWHAEQEDVDLFLELVQAKDNLPIFVHCQHGADRTGTMVAAYRIFVHGWEVDRAIHEMTKGPFGFHRIFQNLPEFLEKYKR